MTCRDVHTHSHDRPRCSSQTSESELDSDSEELSLSELVSELEVSKLELLCDWDMARPATSAICVTVSKQFHDNACLWCLALVNPSCFDRMGT